MSLASLCLLVVVPSAEQVTVVAPDAKSFRPKTVTTVTKTVKTVVTKQEGWDFVAPRGKAKRKVTGIINSCKPQEGQRCAAEVGRSLGLAWVLLLQNSGSRKDPVLKLTLVAVDGDPIASDSAIAVKGSWQAPFESEVTGLLTRALEPPTEKRDEPTPSAEAQEETEVADAAEGESPTEPAEGESPTEVSDEVEVSETIAAAAVEPEPPSEPEPAVEAEPEPTTPSDEIGISFAPKAGVLIGLSNLGVTWLAGIDVAYQPSFIRKSLGLSLGAALEVAYAQHMVTGNASDPAVGMFRYRLDQRLLMLAVEAFVSLPLDPVSVYGGVGYGIYFLTADSKLYRKTTTESQVRGAAQLRAGAGYGLGPGEIFLEARFHWTGLEFVATGESNAGGITVGTGYRFSF